jgi:diguanylate cyclase (GGDEF)-like protein
MIVVLGMFTIVLFLSMLWYFTFRLINKIADARRMIEELAMTDGLTKLYNRRYLMERFLEEFERSKRLGKSLGCIMFDLDYFKRINDQYGHQAGDAVLKKISAIAAEFIRAYDILGRFGGEEFMIVLPETDLADSIRFAERLRELLKNQTIETGAGAVHMTASFGVAVLTKEDSTVDDIIKRADEGLYEAKKTGRDRVCLIAEK